MRFTIITHAEHKVEDSKIFAYEPYVREMNLWGKHVNDIEIIAPISREIVNEIEAPYCKEAKLTIIPRFDVTSIVNILKSCLSIPIIFVTIFKAMKRADHIHLRCPGNIGLLGCIVQLFFQNKPKTAKYAGNWDPHSKQPLSYKFQRWILSNTFLTKNMKVLVYGNWENQTKNIVPFFTATYSEKEIMPIKPKALDGMIKFIFVGGLTQGKQPLLSIEVVSELLKKGFNVKIDLYGEGAERKKIEAYIKTNNLEKRVKLHGNVNKEEVKRAFIEAHFLLFISKSEGWPKVIAEAMVLGCLPISTPVSCVPYMLDSGERGSLVDPKVDSIMREIESYVANQELYFSKIQKAFNWSNEFTLEKFEDSIKKILHED